MNKDVGLVILNTHFVIHFQRTKSLIDFAPFDLIKRRLFRQIDVVFSIDWFNNQIISHGLLKLTTPFRIY